MTMVKSCLSLLLVFITFNTLLVTRAEAQQQAIAFINVNVVPFDRERVLAEQTVIVRQGDLTSQQLQLFLAKIEAAKRNPAEYFAEALKIPRDFGTVEAGLRADLLLLNANPLESVANLSKRAGVMVRGRWLPENELRKMLENVATLNRQTPQESTAKANFAGTWTLDKANSEGLPPGMDQLMTVVQTGDKLSLETKLITEQGEQVVPDSYVLDGKEVDFTPRTPGGESGKGKRTSKLTADGNGIDVSETATFDTPEGTATLKATRKWTLSPDGKTLKIEMTVEGPNGKQVLKRTFVRK